MSSIPTLPIKAYNALFTPMGRKNLRDRLKECRAALDSGYKKNGTFVYALDTSRRFVLHRDNQLSKLIFLERAYEPLETIIVTRAVQRGDVVLDLGANVGYYTALLDGLVKPNGQVHSFEPGQGTFSRLEETKRLLKLERTVLHQKAISDSVGHIDFWLSTAGSDAQQSTVKMAALGEELARQRVAATSLDAFVKDMGKESGRIAFVKCDIEGAELSMIQGAQSLIAAQDPPIWLIEHNRPALREHGSSTNDLLAPFSNHDVYFVPLCWPPSIMASPQASKWSGEDLPDECNLILFPKKGAYAKRVAAVQQAGLLASS
ncbi:MAG: FkbM family methyltransferase [Verrucomicrobiota bacterium]|jgi:FkbM family methyltransferase